MVDIKDRFRRSRVTIHTEGNNNAGLSKATAPATMANPSWSGVRSTQFLLTSEEVQRFRGPKLHDKECQDRIEDEPDNEDEQCSEDMTPSPCLALMAQIGKSTVITLWAN